MSISRVEIGFEISRDRNKMNDTATISRFGAASFLGVEDLFIFGRTPRQFGAVTNNSIAAQYGTRGLKQASISESVKAMAFGASSALSSSLRQRIKDIANLEANWDSEGAKQIKPSVLADAVEALKRLTQQTGALHDPFIAPKFDGYIQLEWHQQNRRLDIEAVEKGWVAVGTEISSQGNQHYYYTSEFERNDFSKLYQFYRWLLGNEELIWPSL